MKRRGFLQVLGAAIAAPLVPKPALVPTPGPLMDLAVAPDVAAVLNVSHLRRERIDVTCFGDVHKVYVLGLPVENSPGTEA